MLYGIPVAELQSRISSAEFAELLAYDRDHGLPDPVRQHEELMALMANLHAPRKGNPWRSSDFGRRPTVPLDSARAESMARGMAAMHNRRRGRRG